MRKAMHQHYTGSVCDAEYLPIIHAEGVSISVSDISAVTHLSAQVQLLRDLLEDPDNFMIHPRRYSCSLGRPVCFSSSL